MTPTLADWRQRLRDYADEVRERHQLARRALRFKDYTLAISATETAEKCIDRLAEVNAEAPEPVRTFGAALIQTLRSGNAKLSRSAGRKG